MYIMLLLKTIIFSLNFHFSGLKSIKILIYFYKYQIKNYGIVIKLRKKI